VSITLIVEALDTEAMRYLSVIPEGVGTCLASSMYDALETLSDYRCSSVIITEEMALQENGPRSFETTLLFLETLHKNRYAGKVYVLVPDESFVPLIAERFSLLAGVYLKEWFFNGEIALEF